MSKDVYFFRHGESLANATKIRQGATTPLTERGRAQAEKLGKRLSKLSLERIVASDFIRAHDTAKIVTRHTGHASVDTSPLFVERLNPSFMLGCAMDDPEVERVWGVIGANYGNPGWRHSDEENFEDLVRRAKQALEFLLKLPEERIGVASHGLFMKIILAHVVLDEHLNGRIFWDQFIPTKNVENTGIMHLQYVQNYHKTGMYWKLASWNDHAHLA